MSVWGQLKKYALCALCGYHPLWTFWMGTVLQNQLSHWWLQSPLHSIPCRINQCWLRYPVTCCFISQFAMFLSLCTNMSAKSTLLSVSSPASCFAENGAVPIIQSLDVFLGWNRVKLHGFLLEGSFIDGTPALGAPPRAASVGHPLPVSSPGPRRLRLRVFAGGSLDGI